MFYNIQDFYTCTDIADDFRLKKYDSLDGCYATRIKLDHNNPIDSMSDEEFLAFLMLLLMQ